MWGTGNVWLDKVVGQIEQIEIGSYIDVCAVGREVPHGVVVVWRSRLTWVIWIGVAPDQLLHWVVVRQTNQCVYGAGGGSQSRRGDGIGTGVLDLLNQVLVTLLSETAALLSVQVHIVAPNLKGLLEESVVQWRQIEIQADLVVLQSNQWQIQTWVAVEEEQQWQIHTNVSR